jgi:nitric oxide reductase NorD protein
MRFRFWEPEETVGTAWHEAVGHLGAEPRFPDALIAFDDVRASTGLMFRALGGAQGVEIIPAAPLVSKHRLSWKRRLAQDVEHVTCANYDGVRLALPAEIALFADRALSRDLYIWLAVFTAHLDHPHDLPDDPLQRDLVSLHHLARAERSLLAHLPRLRALRDRLATALLAQRPRSPLPPVERVVDDAIRHFLGDTDVPANQIVAQMQAETPEWPALAAPEGYTRFRPVAMWPRLDARTQEDGRSPDEQEQGGKGSADGSEKVVKAVRRKGDQAERRDSLILHRFESILSWMEFLNLNRRVEDDDEQNARKASQDLDEVSLVRHSKAAATKLKFHLDLAPQDVDRARLIGEHVYPEWDWKSGTYLPDHVNVYENAAEEGDETVLDKPRTRRRIAAVRRQFEALRPRRRIVRRQIDGFDLDLDEVVRAHCDRLAGGESADRLYVAIRDDERDLAVSVLIDVSRSTESSVSERPVIDIAREALVALMEGLEACGDAVSVHAFSSLRRDRVMVDRIKDFDEKPDARIRRRVMGLKPKYYTRLGAAIRHASRHLSERAAQKRLLLVITDGKPNDLDHYEGRHGIEDTRRAVQEARRLGQAVFAVTVDVKARDYLPHLFGSNGFAIVRDPENLIEALPQMYRHVTA